MKTQRSIFKQNGEGAVIVDAGGGTIDLSTYIRDREEKVGLMKNTFAEISIPRGWCPVFSL